MILANKQDLPNAMNEQEANTKLWEDCVASLKLQKSELHAELVALRTQTEENEATIEEQQTQMAEMIKEIEVVCLKRFG